MSKKALIILGLMAFAALMLAQTEVTLLGPQDFEGTWIPTGWSQNPAYTGSDDEWHQEADPATGETDNAAYCDWEADNDDTLFTPVFDCSGATYDSVILEFDENYRLDTGLGSGEAKIYVSNDGGSTWALAFSYGRTAYLAHHRRLDISTYTGASATCMVAFHYDNSYDWHWAIDNVVINAYEPPTEPEDPIFTFTCDMSLPYGTTSHTYGVTIEDATGVDPATAEFCYSLNDAPVTCETMTYVTGDPDGTGDYEYELTDLEPWDVVEYYFIAMDTYTPANAGTSSTCRSVVEGDYYVYEDGTGYAMSPDSEWVDHTTGFNWTAFAGDDILGTIYGYAFPLVFYGIPSDTVMISTNGWLTFDGTYGGASDLSEDPIPTASAPNALLAWMWDDMDGGNGGSEFWITNDPSGDDWVMFSYIDWQQYPSSAPFSVQIQIWNPDVVVTPGGNCAIDVRWNTLPTDLSDGVMGIENWDGSRGLTYWEDGTLGDPDYLGFTSPTRTIRYCTVQPPNGDIYGNVDLLDRADDSGAEVGVIGLPSYTDLTDAAGDYRINNIPVGTYDVYCTHPVYYPDTAYGVMIVDGDSVEINFTLDPMPIGFIQGYADLTDSPPLGDAGITITEVGSGVNTTTNGVGHFFLDGVIAGDVQVIATYPDYTMAYSPVFNIAVGETVLIDTLFLEPADWWYEDFEDDDGGGVPSGTVWEWGIPSSVGPSSAHSGEYCWGTVIDGNYPIYAYAVLEIPVPVEPDTLYYWQYKDMESGYDGGNLEVSTDGGGTWSSVSSPVPPYDGTLSSSFGNPMGGEVAWYGSLNWHQVMLDLTGTPGVDRIRFRFGSDNSFNYPGWYIDDMQIGDVPSFAGAIEGYVYNCNTYATIEGATVYADGQSGVSDASGYFLIEDVPYGQVDMAAILGGYLPGHLYDVTVFIDDTVSVIICMEPMGIDSLTGHLAYGEDDSVYWEICNPSEDTVWFTFPPLPFDMSDHMVREEVREIIYGPNPSDPDAITRAPAVPKEGTYGSDRAIPPGYVWETYDATVAPLLSMAWGLGLPPGQFWIGNPLTYIYDFIYNRPSGNYTGTFVDVTGVGGSGWMGDMCYDELRGWVWQVAIGGTNDLYAFDPITGANVAMLSDPSNIWDATSQRGVAHDPEEDIFYIGGWNDNLIYKVKGLSWDVPGQTIEAYDAQGCAGVGWHGGRNTIWYAANAAGNPIFEIDPETNAKIDTIFAPTTVDYSLAGLGIDDLGRIWTCDMNANAVYVLNGPVSGMYIEPPDTFIAPGECITYALINDAWTTPVGDYCFDLDYLISDGQYMGEGTIPTCVQVQPRSQKGWELISIPVMATPNDPAIQFADDIVPFVVDHTNSNIYGYNQDDGILELPDGFVRGKGYYLKTWLDYTYWDVYGDAYPEGDFTYTMYYPADSPNWGWWLIGNPFNRRVDWDAVYASNDFTYLDPEYWIWSQKDGWTWYSPIVGGGGEDQYIDAWRGFFVYVRNGSPTTDVPLTFPADGTLETFLAKKAGVAKGAKIETTHPAEFDLRLSVRAVDGSTDVRVDKYNFISVDELATDDIDALDVRQPDVELPTGGIDAFFEESGRRFARSCKQNFSDLSKEWTFKVQGIPAGMDVTINWPQNRVPTGEDISVGVDNLDERWTLTLVDNATGETIDMREVYSYEFVSTTSPRVFTVILGDNPLDIEEDLPREFSLGANVPNPFNATTSFEVALPHDSDVKIEVFDMLGRKVNTLVDGEMKGGYHRIIWEGVDNAGREVASGIYLYRVQAGDFSETKKMTLIK